MERLYPVFLNLAGLPCLVIGGGGVATRKVQGLIKSGAKVTVISPQATAELALLSEQDQIRLLLREANSTDVAGFRLVFCATSNPAVNQVIAETAQASGALVNVADAPDRSTFFVPAVVDRGRLQVAISTSGASPALAKRFREELEGHFGPEYQLMLEVESYLRPLVLQQVSQAERPAVFRLLADKLPDECRTTESPGQLRTALQKLLGINIPPQFEQLILSSFR